MPAWLALSQVIFLSFSDHVHFTTVGVRVPSLSQTSLIPPLSPKKPRDMRERAILNHAYTNPQYQSSGKSVSIENLLALKHEQVFL